MKRDVTRREFVKATGIGAAAMAAGGGILTSSEAKAASHKANAMSSKPIPGFEKPHTDVDLIPGVREQGGECQASCRLDSHAAFASAFLSRVTLVGR